MLRPLSMLLLLAPTMAWAEEPSCLAGTYDGSAPEIAAGLMLASSGRFRYAMSYGALDEQAVGTWTSEGGKLFLTSDPVRAPQFTLAREEPAAANEFRLALDTPDGVSPQYFNAMLVMNDGRTVGSPLNYEPWVLTLKPGEAVVSVKLMLPVLDLESERFVLSAGTGNAVRFAFAPNDMGSIAFAREPLEIDDGVLSFIRHDRRLRFRPESGGCQK